MNVEYRVVIKTVHGTTRRIEMGKKGRDDAIEVGRVYADSATEYYGGSNVTVECREIGCWHDIEEDECEEA